MNTLPPELLSSIIESTAECSSIYESYKERLQTLSTLALVNRTFYQLAQPLFCLEIFVKVKDSEDPEDSKVPDKLKDLVKNGLSHKTIELTLESLDGNYFCRVPQLDEFSNLKALRLANFWAVSLRTLQSHQHLTRLALVDTSVDHDPSLELALPSTVYLTLERTVILVPESYKSVSTPLFLTQLHFPSLRALGLYKYSTFATPSATHVAIPLHPSFLAQLDCLTVDETQLQRLPLPLPVPFLYDVDPDPFLFDDNLTRSGLSRRFPTVNFESASTKTHVRIRFPCEPIARDHQIEAALSFVDDFLGKSTVLKELYLDLYPRDGRRDHVLSWKLGKKIKKLEELAKEKKVEIIWENHEDDWCRSRVLKEFWRRCKEKKDKK